MISLYTGRSFRDQGRPARIAFILEEAPGASTLCSQSLQSGVLVTPLWRVSSWGVVFKGGMKTESPGQVSCLCSTQCLDRGWGHQCTLSGASTP